MSVRKIEFLVSADSVAPETVVCGGRQYEHNATQIDFVIDDDLYELLSKHQESGNLVFRIDALNGEGGYIPLGSIEPINIDGKIVLSYKIGYEITSVGGRCKFTIVASCIDEQSNREKMIFCSADAIVEFDAVCRNDEEYKEFEKGLSSILSEAKGCLIETAYIQDDGRFYIEYANGKTVYVGVSNLLSADRIKDAVKATNDANEAADKANKATDGANDAANDARNVRAGIEAGGFVESLKELNAGNKFSFWVGTKQEYETIPENERVQNCFYLVTDDTTAKDLKTEIKGLKNKYGNVLWDENANVESYAEIVDVLNDVIEYNVIEMKSWCGNIKRNVLNVMLSIDEVTENAETGEKKYSYSGNTTYVGLVGGDDGQKAMIGYGVRLEVVIEPEGASNATVKVYSTYHNGTTYANEEVTKEINDGDEVHIKKLIGIC